MSLIVDEHRQYLHDPVRLSAFDRAIRAHVRGGSVVLDLASGTGILGLMACRAGAARVYSIESGGMVQVARGIAAENGYADRVHFIKGHSMHVALPERVDVVVADQVGNFGFNAGVLEYFADARERFLKPGGVMIPSRVDLVLAPIESEVLASQVSFWETGPAGFKFHSVTELAENTGYQVELAPEPEQVLGAPALLAALPLGAAAAPIRGRVILRAGRAGTLHGIGGWFDAELSPGVTMTNSPLAAARVNRRQVFFPVRPAMRLGAGDEVAVEMTILPRDDIVSWSVESRAPGGGARQRSERHSTWKGMLLNREDVARTSPDSVPVLNPRGMARRTVVDLCDGRRSLREIEDLLWQRHRELFASRSEAEEFAAEVMTRYAL
jgi:SAM-dependent methyltransferase